MNDHINEPKSPSFGGGWSDKKLETLSKYLAAYTNVLKNQRFSLVYIDAFAGAGRVNVSVNDDDSTLFSDEKEENQYRHGSPLAALSIDPPFARYVFIDKDEQAIRQLEAQVIENNHSGKSIEYVVGDANKDLIKICDSMSKSQRAVVFIDPFATEVKWSTIEKISRTEIMDLWLLFPAMAVNRMLTRTGDISKVSADRITACFGTDEWKKVFYEGNRQATLPIKGDSVEEDSVVKVNRSYEVLSEFVRTRLKTSFPGVCDQNLILRNSKKTPLFLLCFACSNPSPKAHGLAVKLANHIIGKAS